MTAMLGEPRDPEALEWDVVVVGTGMGGGTAGYELSRRGRNVLFIEKGWSVPGVAPTRREGTDLVDSHGSDLEQDPREARLATGWWSERIQADTSFGASEFYAPLGCGVGGSTALYAAALERFSPSDFEPRANYPDVADSTLPDRWPITYDEFRSYYARAETLFRVRGTPDPLDPRGSDARLLSPPPMSPRDQHLYESFGRLGLHPYRIHVGCEFVDGCTGCVTAPCSRGCKRDAASVCVLPAVSEFGARVLLRCEAMRLEAGPSRVEKVRCRWNGKDIAIRAKVVVLAAGAYMSPRLLLASASSDWPGGLANHSGMVGRNLMVHASDFFAVVPLQKLSGAGVQKSLAMNDFYHAGGAKLGSLQTIGAAPSVGTIMQYMRDEAERDPAGWKHLMSPTPRWWRKLSSPAVRLAALALYHLVGFKNAAIWASVIEDLPYHDNRVLADPGAMNGMRIVYRYPDELRSRVRLMRREVTEALRPHRVVTLSGDNNLNFGHACGTCRFGDDPRSSVLDRDNRAHGISNLFVVDASFFPSSSGTNPSLTIAANALRVAEAIHDRLT